MEVFQTLCIVMVQVFCYNVFFSSFLRRRDDSKVKQIASLVLLFVLHIVCWRIDIYPLRIILIVICTGLIMSLVYCGRYWQYFLLAAGVYAITLASDALVFLVANVALLSEQSDIWHNPQFILPVISNSISILVIFDICKYREKGGRSLKLTREEWYDFFVFPICTVILMFPVILLEPRSAVYLCLVIIMVFEFIYFSLILIVQKRERMNYEKELVDINTVNQLKQYENREQAYREQQKKLHDFNNHMACIYDLLGQNKYEVAMEYLEGIRDNYEVEASFINTNHEIINSIIRTKLSDAKVYGIEMVTSLMDFSGITVANEDLVVLITNLLDNAIEACKQLEKPNRKIIFRMEYNNGELVISTQNRFEKGNSVEEVGATSKEDKENHGYGMINIKEVANKYDGEDIISRNENIYTHTVILNINN